MWDITVLLQKSLSRSGSGSQEAPGCTCSYDVPLTVKTYVLRRQVLCPFTPSRRWWGRYRKCTTDSPVQKGRKGRDQSSSEIQSGSFCPFLSEGSALLPGTECGSQLCFLPWSPFPLWEMTCVCSWAVFLAFVLSRKGCGPGRLFISNSLSLFLFVQVDAASTRTILLKTLWDSMLFYINILLLFSKGTQISSRPFLAWTERQLSIDRHP